MTRSPCIVPGCRNTSAKHAGRRYICSTHWPMVPKHLKRRHRRICHILIRRGELMRDQDGLAQAIRLSDKGWRAMDRSWGRIERAAIEAGAGI